MKIRVIHNTPVWLPQTQTWIHAQVDCVPRDRIESHVVCERVVNLDQFTVQHLHDFSRAGKFERFADRVLRRSRVRRHLGYLTRVARSVDAKVMHSHFGNVAWQGIGAARSAGCRHVATFYGYDMSNLPNQPLWRKRLSELFRKADLFLCEGAHMASRVAALGCPPEKIRIHHLGVRLENLPFRPRVWQPGQALRVLIGSAFTEKKGIPYALRALSRVSAEVDLEITLVGDAHPGSPEGLAEKHRILAAITQGQLGDRVRMTGFVSHAALVALAYDHHVYLAPSVTAGDGATEGGAPVSVIEMAATGMLVISSRHCDIPGVIIEEEGGFLSDERDVEGIADCLRKAIAAPRQVPGMLAFSRKHIEAEFSAFQQGLRLAAIYEGLANIEN